MMIAIVLILTIGGGGYVYLESKKVNKIEIDNTETSIKSTSTNTVSEENNTESATTTIVDNDTDISTSSDLWVIFDRNVLALKNKDIKSLNEVSYHQVSPSEEKDFLSMSQWLYETFSGIKKDEYINKLGDDKQYIYSTSLRKVEEGYAYTQGEVIFIKNGNVWKLLSYNPEKYWGISKTGTNKTLDQAEVDLLAMTKDSDKDGLTDSEETCSGASKYNPSCIKTDPNDKDTDRDGWWDGTEKSINDL